MWVTARKGRRPRWLPYFWLAAWVDVLAPARTREQGGRGRFRALGAAVLDGLVWMCEVPLSSLPVRCGDVVCLLSVCLCPCCVETYLCSARRMVKGGCGSPGCPAGVQGDSGEAVRWGQRGAFNKGNQQGRCIPRLATGRRRGPQGQGTELYLQRRLTDMSH